jgi:hypothetical protein
MFSSSIISFGIQGQTVDSTTYQKDSKGNNEAFHGLTPVFEQRNYPEESLPLRLFFRIPGIFLFFDEQFRHLTG